ncbi:MAG: MFS transporter [Dehalococcoidia bacterium]|nr:MFS transporter [Dehalococcoidia bacterium]
MAPRSGEEHTVFYGWVMVAALFLIMFFSLGPWYSFGVFLPYLIGDLETSRALAAGVISVAWIPYGVMGIVAGVMLDKRGPRAVTATGIFIIGLAYLLTSQASAVWHLYLFLGVTLGLGMGVTWVVPTATVSKWFERRRGMALGILLASVGTGQMIMPPLAQFLIGHWSWQTAYIVLGCLIWVGALPLTLLLRRSPEDVGLLPDGAKENARISDLGPVEGDAGGVSWTARQAIRTRPFWLLVGIWLFLPVSIQMIIVHVVGHARDAGIPPELAATLLSVMGLSLFVGRLVIGGVSDRLGSRPTYIGCLLLQLTALLGFIWVQDLWAFYVLMAMFGFSVGGSTPVYTKIAAELFGRGATGAIIGLVSFAWSLGSATGPWLAGRMFDTTGSYSLAFAAGAALVALALVLVLLLHPPPQNTAVTGTQAQA